MFGVDDAALAMLLGGAISTAGSMWTNREYRKNQKAINDNNAAIAALNNATQIELSNTAHQREVKDLRAAGLNPILSAGGNGAGVPVLRSPEMGTPQVDNPVSALGGSVQGASRYVSEQYRQGLEAQALGNTNTDLINKLLARENELDVVQKSADTAKANAEEIQNQLIEDAWRDIAGLHSRILKDGTELLLQNTRERKEAVDRIKAGIISGQRKDSWQALQAWMPHFVNAAGAIPTIGSKWGKLFKFGSSALKGITQ